MGVVADKGVPPGWGRQIEQIFLMMGVERFSADCLALQLLGNV